MHDALARLAKPPARLRVVLVDDDEAELALLQAVAGQMTQYDLACTWTPNPDAALERVRNGDADIVLVPRKYQPSVARLAATRRAYAVYDKGELCPKLLTRLLDPVGGRCRPTIELVAVPDDPPAQPEGWRRRAAEVAGIGSVSLDGDCVVDADARACELLRSTRSALIGTELFTRLWSVDEGGSRPGNWYLVDPTDPNSAVELRCEHTLVTLRDASADYERSLLLEAMRSEMRTCTCRRRVP